MKWLPIRCRLGWHRFDYLVQFVYTAYEECSRCNERRTIR